MKSVSVGHHLFECCILPCSEHCWGVNISCRSILVYILKIVSLKENSWVMEFEIFMSYLIDSWKTFE